MTRAEGVATGNYGACTATMTNISGNASHSPFANLESLLTNKKR